MITENLSTLKIHKLTQDQYDRELASGRIDPNALYLTPDEEIDLSGYATKDQLDAVDTSITELTNDNDAVHNELRAAIAAKSDFSGKYADLEGKPEIPSTEGLATVEQLNKINDSIANITNGTTKVEKATTADTATHATFADTATTAANATNAESASKDASGNVITSTYETKIDASAKLAEAKEYTNTAVANLLNNSTEAVDSIYELRDAMEENANVVDALEAAIGTKANTSDLTLHVSNVSNPHKVTLNQLGAIIKEGAGTNSLIVDEGVASGAHSVAGGTTDKTMINDLIGSAAGLLVNLEPAEATGAGSFSLGASTKSVAPGAMSIGVESIAGGKGYYIYAIDFTNKVITLSKKQTSQSKPSSLTWAKNDVVSIFYNTGHYECSKITNVNTTNGTITVDSLPITEFSRPTSILGVSSALPHDCTIYVVSKPTSGEVELGFGSYSRGYGNKTFGVMSNAIGYQNVAVDTASFVTGRENVGSFGSLVGGYLNKALKENSTAFGRENSALANYSFATGKSTTASGTYATSAGLVTTASGNASQTSGYKTVASADNAHAEGNTTQATASQAHG